MRTDELVRLFAPVWQIVYVLVHLWWVIGGAPRFLGLLVAVASCYAMTRPPCPRMVGEWV